MSSYLIDSHVLLWSVEGKLEKTAADIIGNDNNVILVSFASLWELYIKASVKKLQLEEDFPEMIESLGFTVLNFKFSHLKELKSLPHIHRDPFDRMIIAQARAENIKLITADPEIMKYDVKWIDAGERYDAGFGHSSACGKDGQGVRVS